MSGQTEKLLGRTHGRDLRKIHAVVGFDGFIDEVLHVAGRRIDAERYERVGYLADHGRKILEAAGETLTVELVPVQRKMGGNGPIFANSLAKLGMSLTYIGTLGKGDTHPVFAELAGRAELFSLGDPALTDALEFYDGKMISSRLEALKKISWEKIIETVPPEALLQIFDRSRLAGFENWTMIVHMTEIWRQIQKEVLPRISRRPDRILFLDLADPAKRLKEDILDALACIPGFREVYRVILGLNEKEAYGLASLYGREKDRFGTILETAEFLREKTRASVVVIHPVRTACAAGEGERAAVQGPYCARPKLTTGAGDNFNAGFVFGQLAGCTLEESLLLGTANSGFYVRHGYSASREELEQFLSAWLSSGISG